MRDVQDFHKYVDMLSKSVSRRAPQGQPALEPTEEPAEQGSAPAALDDSTVPPQTNVVKRSSSALRQPDETGRSPRPAETREQLLRRLLDPTLTLDETARILEVCSTTVRRYTDRAQNPLPCQRSAGNQRRFKLSQVLNFKEGQPVSAPVYVSAPEAGE